MQTFNIINRKKKLISLLLAIVMVVGMLPSSAFAEGEGAPPDEHSHTWDAGTVVSDSTCTEAGTMIHTCSCGATTDSVIQPKGHSFSEWTVTIPATCTADGTQTRTCSVCNTVETGTVPATGHQWGEWTYITEPTCTVGGERVRVCSVCGAEDDEILSALGHSWGEWTETVAATCTEAGSKTHTCNTCGTVAAEDVAALGHDWNDGEVTEEPDCVNPGVKTYTCLRCSDTKTENVSALGHDWDEGEVTAEPDCVNPGAKTFTCLSCNDTKTEEVPALGHEWGEWFDITEPTCSEVGSHTHTCAVCELTETEEIPTVDHEWSEWEVTTEPTCTEEGEQTRTCAVCKGTETGSVPAKGHVWDAEDERDAATCTVCGEKREDTYVYDIICNGEYWRMAGNDKLVEKPEFWNRMFKDTVYTRDWAQDLLTIASSQIGYHGQSDNYLKNKAGVVRYYTRYGDWFGDSYEYVYGDWCAMFVSFCLYYARIPVSSMPWESSCVRWVRDLKDLGIYADKESYIPEPGDLIFFDYPDPDLNWEPDGNSDHVGIVLTVDEENGIVTTIEGAVNNEVATHRYELGDRSIMGYAKLPENPELAEEDTEYPEFTYNTTVDGMNVSIAAPEGAFPKDTTVTVTGVEAEEVISAVETAVAGSAESDANVVEKKVVTVKAVDITFRNKEGDEIQPLIPISVVLAPVEKTETAEVALVHIDDEGVGTLVEDVEQSGEELAFSADSFSTYVYTSVIVTRVIDRRGDTWKISVTFASDAQIPDNAVLSAEEITEGYETYQEYYDRAAAVVAKQDKFLETVRLFDISIISDGMKIQPEAAVTVSIELEEKLGDDLAVLHLSDSDELITSLKPAAFAGTSDSGTETAAEAVSFTANGFSVYAVAAGTLQKEIRASDGNSYLVEVAYGMDAGVPDGAELEVTEILSEEGSDDYYDYMLKTADALATEAAELDCVRFFDISIVKDGEKVIIAAPVDVSIRLLDREGDPKSLNGTKVVHFADGEETGSRIYDVTVEGAEVGFSAEGFSVYALVSGPLSSPEGWYAVDSTTDIDAMMEAGQGLYIQEVSGNGYYSTNQTYSNGNGIKLSSSVGNASEYFFEKKEGSSDEYYIYYKDDSDAGHYVRRSGTNLSFVDSKVTATAWKLAFTTTGEVRFYNIQTGADHDTHYYWAVTGSGTSRRIYAVSAWDNTRKINDPTKGSKFRLIYESDGNDPYGLDGKSYSILRWDGGSTAKALTGDEHESIDGNLCAEFLTVMSRTGENTDKIYVPNDYTDTITSWTFEWEGTGKQYKLRTTVGSSVKYLKIDATGLHMVDSAAEASSITVTAGTGIHAGQIMLKAGNKTLTYSGKFEDGFNTTGATGLEWLYLAEDEPESIISDYYKVNSAQKISVSDDSLLPQSEGDAPKQVIIYTRAWNGHGYTYFAIDGNGKLVPCTENGDTIEWIGSGMDELLWDFTVYGKWENGEFTPNNYYEFQNTYTDKYLAPLMPVLAEDGVTVLRPGQILSDSTIGVIMPGRRNGQYYSQTLVWDNPNYAFDGINVDLDAGDEAVIEACPKRLALDIYFAIVQPVNPDDELLTVPTVDNNLYGIEMYMVNFDGKVSGGGCDTTGIQTQYLIDNTFRNMNQTPNLLSTNLEGNGYPKGVLSGLNLSGLYANEVPVNHLFIQSTYDATGYYVFDSTQNYATLYDVQNNGAYNGGDFIVYQEIGTYDTAIKPSLKHGQFFPYNVITPGVFADPSKNGLNLYTTTQQPLPENDPRYNEQLYLISTPGTNPNVAANQVADYWFGMELKAGFVQTPSGLDEWGHDIIFEFSGDDDFWLYVDGELIIDLGGIHSAMAGNVNFRTGQVYVNGTNTTLYDLFYNHYTQRDGLSPEEARKKLLGDPNDAENYPGIFEVKNDPDYGSVTTFKDNTNHTMKIFYMERGAGASNLYMRFNLSAVKKGTVQLTKELKESDGEKLVDISENSIAVYPYQIWYKDPRAGHEGDPYILFSPPDGTVKYLGTTEEVTYRRELSVDYENAVTGVTERVKYNDVYLVKPSETIEITFPTYPDDDDGNPVFVEEYMIKECGVDPDIFEYVKVNDTLIEPTSVMTTFTVDGNGNEQTVSPYEAHLVNFEIPFDTLDNRAKVIYDNVVKETKRMTIQKELYKKLGESHDPEMIELYDANGEPKDPDNPDLLRSFDFRVEFKTPYDDDFTPANIYSYHVIDPAGYYCKWQPNDPAHADPNDPDSTGRFVRILHSGQGVSDFDELTEDEQFSATFDTSMNGAISNIPAYYLVELVGLLPGTQYKVVERPTETPDGYQFWQYGLNDEGYDVDDVWDGIIGKIPVNGASDVLVRNYKGYALRLIKDWADASTVLDRDAAYFAVYYETLTQDGSLDQQVLVEGSVRQLLFSAKPQEILWSYLNLPDVTGFDHDDLIFHNYVVREVVLENPVVVSGNVTYDDITPLEDIVGVVFLNATLTAGGEPELIKYRVEYDDPVEIGDNYMEYTVHNIPADKPAVMFYKTTWDWEEPLGGSKFTLYNGDTSVWSDTNENNVTTYERTSRASDGWIATEFLTKAETYTFTETKSTQGYAGVPFALSVVLNYNESDDEWTLDVTPNDDDSSIYYSVGHVIIENDEGVITEEYFKLTVRNRPYELQALKLEKNTDVPVEGAKFELYKQTTSGGTTGWQQVTWTEGETTVSEIVSGEDGVIPHLDNTLAPGTYQLRETEAPVDYASLTETYAGDVSQNYGYINFTVSDLGVITLGAHPDVVTLESEEDTDGKLFYTLKIPNEPTIYEVKLKKVDSSGSGLEGAKFTLEKEAGDAWVPVDLDPETDGVQNEIDMSALTECTVGLSRGYYHLRETVAPNGYIIQIADIYFSILDGVVALTDEDGTAVTEDDNPYVGNNITYVDIIPPDDPETVEEPVTIYTIRVWNYTSEELPKTGGIGTFAFWFAGAMLFTGSAMLFLMDHHWRKRRRRKSE